MRRTSAQRSGTAFGTEAAPEQGLACGTAKPCSGTLVPSACLPRGTRACPGAQPAWQPASPCPGAQPTSPLGLTKNFWQHQFRKKCQRMFSCAVTHLVGRFAGEQSELHSPRPLQCTWPAESCALRRCFCNRRCSHSRHVAHSSSEQVGKPAIFPQNLTRASLQVLMAAV